MILVQSSVERRDLGKATTGVRFTETLGASVAAAVFATLFAAGTAHGHRGPRPVMGTLHLIFALGAGLLAVATVIGTRLPRDRRTKTPGGQLGHTEQPV
jgi:hypothetical protein